MPEFDARDEQILVEREAAFNEKEGFRVGDFVRFADGVLRRISHIWPDGVQTSNVSRSYYLGEGYVSYSGGLYTSVKNETLTLTDEKPLGQIWFFHHGWMQAHNGVEASIRFRLYECSQPSTVTR